jgi:hypothetical protein
LRRLESAGSFKRTSNFGPNWGNKVEERRMTLNGALTILNKKPEIAQPLSEDLNNIPNSIFS